MFTILGADGKEYGPVTAARISEWISGGRANLATKAKRVDEAGWRTLGEFPEFNSAPAAAVAPTAAPAFTPVAAPDTAGLLPAGRWSRLGAHLLDGLIGCGAALPGFGLLIMAGIFSHPDEPNPALLVAGIAVLGLALIALLVFQIYLLTTRGQTLGKKMMGIRIVSHEDATNPGFVKAFLLRSLVNGLIGAVPVIGGIYTLVDICFIFREDRRCIHDFIAGTKVVVA